MTVIFIYALLLEEDKYYIGRTTKPDWRLEDHFSGNGSYWTHMYKPKTVLEMVQGDIFDEDKYTIKYMAMHGIDNVRGGSFCAIVLDAETRNVLEKMLKGSGDMCYTCGEKGHYVKDCRTIHAPKMVSVHSDTSDVMMPVIDTETYYTFKERNVHGMSKILYHYGIEPKVFPGRGGHHAIYITCPMEQYTLGTISRSTFLDLIRALIGKMEIPDNEKAFTSAFNAFLKTNVRKEIDASVTKKIIPEFLAKVLQIDIRKIQGIYTWYLQDGRTAKSEELNETWINMVRSYETQGILMEIVFFQESFISRIQIDTRT